MDSKSEVRFKVGSVYADVDGNLVRLYASKDVGMALCMDLDASGHEGEINGKVYLYDGTDPSGDLLDLIPGELHQIGGQWVPVAGEVPHPDEFTLEELIADLQAAKPYTIERIRPPLTWNAKTPFDNFPGYSVTSETHADEPAPRHALQRSPDLEPSRAQVLPGFGSAHLAR